MENFENNNEEEKLRAESMMDEAAHNRFVLGKDDPIDEMSSVRLAAERFGDISDEYEAFKDYLNNVKNVDTNLLKTGQRQEMVDSLKETVENLKQMPAGKYDQKDVESEIKKAKEIIRVLSLQNEEAIMEIEKFANSDRPSGYRDEKDAWKN